MREKDLYPLVRDWHSAFDTLIWGANKPSFHNEFHIFSVLEAGTRLLEQASKNMDPLDIQGNLKKWNHLYPEFKLTFEEFGIALKIALTCHDLGNICETLDISSKDNPVPTYLNGYKSKDAEKRSQEISAVIISKLDADSQLNIRLTKIVGHLIGETTLHPGSDITPFGLVMRLIDQIGSRIFNQVEKKEMERGLLEEMLYENPDVPLYNPDYFFNFPIRRITELGFTQSMTDDLLETWGKPLPEENFEYGNTPIKVSEAIRIMDDLLIS